MTSQMNKGEFSRSQKISNLNVTNVKSEVIKLHLFYLGKGKNDFSTDPIFLIFLIIFNNNRFCITFELIKKTVHFGR